MTIMTPIEGITAPAIAADPARGASNPDNVRPALPVETFLPCDETPLLSSRRADGWSAANQRLFLEAIAEGFGVEQATMRVGLSAASAYAFRRTAKGAAFALGWRAANLVARDAIAETLLVRALEGTVDTYVRGETVITRHKFDNRLALSLLARLDRQVESAPDADVKAARLVAQEFDAYLDLVARDDGPARAGLFLARRAGGLASGSLAPDTDSDSLHDLAPIFALAAADRLARTGVATAEEVEVTDLDPAARAHWTADQWQRAEAAGLLALAVPDAETQAPPSQLSQHSAHAAGQPGCSASRHEPGRRVAEPTRPTAWLDHAGAPEDSPTPSVPDQIWWDEDEEDWRTGFPPRADDPPDFEDGTPDQHMYQRSLTETEAALMGPGPDQYSEGELAELAAERDRYFEALRAEAAAAALPPPPANDGVPAEQDAVPAA